MLVGYNGIVLWMERWTFQLEENSFSALATLCIWNTIEIARDIYWRYTNGAIAKRITQECYVKFEDGGWDLEDVFCSGSPFGFDNEHEIFQITRRNRL